MIHQVVVPFPKLEGGGIVYSLKAGGAYISLSDLVEGLLIKYLASFST